MRPEQTDDPADRCWHEIAGDLRELLDLGPVGGDDFLDPAEPLTADRRFQTATTDRPPADAGLRGAPLRKQRIEEMVRYAVSRRDDLEDDPGEMTVERLSEWVSVSGIASVTDLQRLLARAEQRPGDARQLADALLAAGRLNSVPAAADDESRGRLEPGMLLGDYVILEQLGSGGMGRVDRAIQVSLDRQVALKTLSEHDDNERAVARFDRERRVAARLDHPNVVRVFDGGVIDKEHYLALEYIDGCNLAELTRRHHPLPVKLVVRYIRQVALGLAHAHACGIIHRDVKPSNLMLGRRGVVKLTDFGLARFFTPQGSDNEDDDLTNPGAALGTFNYMSPEQAVNACQADARSDIYSLGCTMYYLLLGRSPVQNRSLDEKVAWHREAPVPSLRDMRSDVPADVDIVFQRMLARRPNERYQSTTELVEALGFLHDRLAGERSVAPEMSVLASDSRLSEDRMSTEVPSRTMPSNEGSPLSDKASPDVAPQTIVRPLKQLATTTAGVPKDYQKGSWPLLLAVVVSIVILAAVAVGGWLASDRSWINQPQPQPVVNSIGMQLIRIPAGSFKMGSDGADPDAIGDEMPRHNVLITKPFYLGRFEVTELEYVTVMGQLPQPPADPTSLPGRLPVVEMTWQEARDFCDRLSKFPAERLAGRRYRLPTEAEWEYACRAGTTTRYWVGNKLTRRDANIRIPPQPGKPPVRPPQRREVGKYRANPFGLFDMHGNVREWCADLKADYWPEDAVDPNTQDDGDQRVVRGGGWGFVAAEGRSANRYERTPEWATDFVGFRVVCEQIETR